MEGRDCTPIVLWLNVGHGHFSPPVSARSTTEPNGSKTAENMRTTSGGSISTLTMGDNVLHPAKQFTHPLQSDFRRKYIEKDRKKLGISLRCRLVGSYRRFGTISSPFSRNKRSKKNKVVEWINMAHNRNRWLPGINRLKLGSGKWEFLDLLITYSLFKGDLSP